mgnify:CR=1 FL=1
MIWCDHFRFVIRATLLISVVVLALCIIALPAVAQPESLVQTKQKAEQGDAAAQFNLGMIYEMASGVPEGRRAGGEVVSPVRRTGECQCTIEPELDVRDR